MLKKITLGVQLLLSISSIGIAAECFLGVGYREDNFNWNIAGHNHFPNVLSELEWNDIQMAEVTGGIAGEMYDCMYYRVIGSYAKAFKGENVDTDYDFNDREGMFSKSVNKSDRGYAYDLSVGIGYPLHYCSNNLVLIPLVGYSYMYQKYTMRDGNQVYAPLIEDTGPFQGLNSHFGAAWSTVWLGFDAAYQFNNCYRVFGTFEFHIADYHGTGHWNLRPDFPKDFQQKGWGGGPYGLIGVEYFLDKCLTTALSVSYRYMRVKDGTEKTYFYDDFGNIIHGEAPLNQVNWHSFRVFLSLDYDF